ncbi:NitT/TauT family transport system permease protein [Roseinatronobacter monicus]|uniref:NitT/TauT family transport system permease protein n=2 Tax=Roseinatronobacter monicus TaxID=393481 RepID=A0A543KEA8_9RHOB|nr:NitT/TauT family transport system permease protein [Roseinatronobacter monicus]
MMVLRDSGGVQWAGMTLGLLAAIAFGMTGAEGQPAFLPLAALLAALLVWLALPRADGMAHLALLALMTGAVALAAWGLVVGPMGHVGFWAAVIAVWLGAWMLVAIFADLPRADGLVGRLQSLLAPLTFGATLLWLWEVTVRALEVPRVILPAPSAIWARILRSTDVLWVDFVQTFVKGALSGYAIGVGAALVFALLVDRSDFLRRGLLPVGNFLAALPIIGTAPIMVMWFGFDWPSKAAVVVAMVFFPMLVNTVQGLAATEAMQRDLMRTYNASWGQSLLKLRLPAAMPFIFNGLKIASTLALIGAIVAEFFGSPTRGMGFRISTEVGRLQLDMVWAEIAVAALAGSLFYGIIALVEKGVTFWHPSQRGR